MSPTRQAKKKYAEKYCATTPEKLEHLTDRQRKVLDIFSVYASNHNVGRILDIGCGDGNFTMLVGKACSAKELYGIEISEKGVAMAIKNGLKVVKLDIDDEDFPFDDNTFDAVFAGEIIEHLFDPDHFLAEVYRVLNPGSVFVLTTPNLASIHNRIALLFGYQPFPLGISARMNIGRIYEPKFEDAQSLDHVRVFALDPLKKLLKIHNFDIVDVKGSCAMLPENMRFKRFVNLVDKVFILFPSLSYRVVVICIKEGRG